MTIFVSIASYRDAQLIPTIHSALRKAKWPADLRFGICWQHGRDESRNPCFDDPRFRVLDVPWQQSRGACWARAEVMALWQGEDHFLQIDSHMRFVDDWDAKLVEMLASTGRSRAVLSSYPAAFDPRHAKLPPGEPLQADFLNYEKGSGLPAFRAGPIRGYRDLQRPVRARYLAAGFVFSRGRFAKDIPYDPALYFQGEEIALTVRAYTNGYDLFHPHRHVVWHEYDRPRRPKHWTDHVDTAPDLVPWHVRDQTSKTRLRRLLRQGDLGAFGLGNRRTLADFERYAGLTLSGAERTDAGFGYGEVGSPPERAGGVSRREWSAQIVVPRDLFAGDARSDGNYVYIAFHDSRNREIFRQDADRRELEALLRSAGRSVKIRRTFIARERPCSWTVWPHSARDGWLDARAGRRGIECART